jgi:hypothetical protein
MIGYTPPPAPTYSVTGGGYWPLDRGTIPLPVRFDDDGSTYVVIVVSNPQPGDSASNINFGNSALLATTVPLTAGDADQSVTDIAGQITADTSGQWVSGPVSNGMAVMYWSGYDFPPKHATPVNTPNEGANYVSVNASPSVTAVATRWVLTPAADHSTFPLDRAYFVMDALGPGANTLRPASPTYPDPYIVSHDPRDLRTQPPVTSLRSLWLYFPLTHTARYVEVEDQQGDDTRWLVALRGDEVSGLQFGDYVPFVPIQGAASAPRIQNIGGASSLLNGQPLPPGIAYDRSGNSQTSTVILYEAGATTLAITTNA